MSDKNNKAKNKKTTTKKTAPKKKKLEKLVSVDLWRTDKMKSALFGIKKLEEIRAKSFQFSKDMNVYGEIKEDGKPEGYLGVRGIYQEERLVCKLFTENWSWLGSIEETIARGVNSSFTREKVMPEFIINLSKSEYIIELEKVGGGFLRREIFSLGIATNEPKVESFKIISKLGFGDDWAIYSLQRGKVAILDGHLFDIGGEYSIKIYDPELANSREFIEAMILFVGSLKYHSYAVKRIEVALKSGKKQKKSLEVPNDELELYRNPRRIKT